MAIKINGTVAIDDDRNFSNIGILTVGTGSSSITINSSTNFTCGSTVFNGNNGNISIAGTFSAPRISLPLDLG